MGGGQQGDPAARRRNQGPHVLRGGDLVHRQHLRVHGPEEEHQPLGLGTALRHVGAPAHLQLRLSVVHPGHLSPLVGQGHPPGDTPLPLGHRPDQVPQKGGLAQARRGQNQGVGQPPLGAQPVQHGGGRPSHLPGNPQVGGGNGPQAVDFPVPQAHRAAQADAVPPLKGEVTPAHLVQHRVEGGPAGDFHQLLQLRPPHRSPTQGALPPFHQHRHGPAHPQAQLLGPGPVRLGEGQGLLPQPQGQGSRGLDKAVRRCHLCHVVHQPLSHPMRTSRGI